MAAALLQGNPISLRFDSIERGASIVGYIATSSPDPQYLTIGTIVDVALRLDYIREALLANAQGGSERWFKAYESLCYAVLDLQLPQLSKNQGSKEWLLENGMIGDKDDERFLAGRNLSGNAKVPPVVRRFLPHEAMEFVNRTTLNVIRFCARNALPA
jgi:hypothetical protein